MKFTTDTRIDEPWYALFFDRPVLDGVPSMGDHTFGYRKGRADKFPAPENSFVFRVTAIDSLSTSHWIPGQEFSASIPSDMPVKLVRILSGSSEDGREENFTFPCEPWS